MKSKVVLLRCESYSEEAIYKKIQRGFELLGGPEQFLKRDEKIMLKLNLVRGAEPERAVTTHPAVAAAVSEFLSDGGYKHISAGDSSGFGSSVKIMEELGLKEPFIKYGVKMADFKTGVKKRAPKHRALFC